ncbi:MAG: N-acetyl sugar amidotransferase [Bacteroidetes bacterium]|nr:MAG: N-acetyl sugar amidotransferase [Bacteroidota bacterium]
MEVDRKKVQVCTRCVMDNISDSTIIFEADGTCNYCNDALKAIDTVYFPDESGKRTLEAMIDRIRKEGKGKQYDCLMGISGGLDSSYVAYLGHKYGLRVLLLHIDDGFDSKVTTENISRICNTFKLDLIVERPDEAQFNDLVRAFILAGVPDICLLQDSVLFSILYRTAVKNKIGYFLSGFNFSLESITQSGMDYTDRLHIRDIHRKFGQVPWTGKLKLFSIFDKRIKYGFFHNIKSFKPLFFLDFNAGRAFSELNEACGYEFYGNKHCESTLIKFLQVYYLPFKFNIDKRKSHYSSMIVSGQLTRKEAMEKLKEPQFDDLIFNQEIDFVLNKIGMTKDDFDRIMSEPPRLHSDYRTSYVNKMTATILKMRKKLLGY